MRSEAAHGRESTGIGEKGGARAGQVPPWVGTRPAKLAESKTAPSLTALARRQASGVLLRLAAIAAWILIATQVLLWSRLSVLRSGYEVSAARQMVSRLEEEERRLEIEAELLSDPANLGREARRRLGMRPPRAGEIVGIQ